MIRVLRIEESMNRIHETDLGVGSFSYVISGDFLRVSCKVVHSKLNSKDLKYISDWYTVLLNYFGLPYGEFEFDLANRSFMMRFNIRQYLLGHELPF